MIRRALLRLAMAIAAALALGAIGPAQAAQTHGVAEEESERQILVMLRMAPPHFRPNSGYSGSYGDSMSNAARRRMARRIAQRHGLQLVEGWPMPLLEVDCYVMSVPGGMSIPAVIEKVSKEPGVAWSQPMYRYEVDQASGSSLNDPLFRVQPTAGAWRLAELQRVSTGSGMKIAIIDSKIDVRHPDLAGQFLLDRDFVEAAARNPEAHGTRIAGIIGAKAGNQLGIAGVAPGAKLMALRACREVRTGADSASTFCRTLALARALQFAIENGADIVNLSLAGPHDQLLAQLVEVAVARDVSVIAAFDRNLPQGGFPASERGVIPVADESLQSLPEGVYGAPGRDLPTTQPGGGWSLVNGTSYAVAQVSGLMALVGGKRASRTVLVRAPGGRIKACSTLLGTSPDCDCFCASARKLDWKDAR